MSERSPDKILSDLNGHLESIMNYLLPYESHTRASKLMLMVLSARRDATELGETLSNDPENKKIKERIAELEGQVGAFTKQLAKMISESDQKDTEIERLKKLNKELSEKKSDEPSKDKPDTK